jgi:hypothetical protein
MDTLEVVSLMGQVKTANEEPSEKKEESEAKETDEMTKMCNSVQVAIRQAGVDEQQFKYALGGQWVAKVVSSVVEQIVNRPQLFQTMVDGIIDRIKARL